jgi:hypothetical protein
MTAGCAFHDALMNDHNIYFLFVVVVGPVESGDILSIYLELIDLLDPLALDNPRSRPG